ncbi:MAG: hypothetical protein KJ587_11905 [Alphaproteobacteria bacterium]|nr:hypothetical protein [Alphaproteobacteria bacterium]
MSEVKDDIMPSATPSEDEIRRWNALPRDEQLKRMRQALIDGEQSGLSERSMDEIKAAARGRVAKLRNG